MKSIQDKEALKQAINAVSPLADELVDQLFGICQKVQFKKGAHFLYAGDVPKSMGLNLNGIFRLYYIDQDGNDMTKGFCIPGRYVVAYSALAQNRPSFFAIEAIADSDILQFEYAAWQKLIEQDERWYPYIFKLVEALYIMKEFREKSFLLDSATDRYLSFKQEYASIESQLKLYHIASFLGITPETLKPPAQKPKIDLDQGTQFELQLSCLY